MGVIYLGSDEENVYALTASTGAKLWSAVIGFTGAILARRSERSSVYIASAGAMLITTSC
jgi:outer membrane protein assembly factor BamB